MNSIEMLATFFGWCSAINIGILVLALTVFSFAHDVFSEISSKIFGISKEEAAITFFRVFQQYRLFIAVFNIVPYIALRIMA